MLLFLLNPSQQMPIERYFTKEHLQAQRVVELRETEFHHLAHVMRMRKGEAVELVNGQGQLAQAVIQTIAKDRAQLHIEEVQEEAPLPYSLILAQALPKPNRLDFILEKGTELGVDAFWLFPGDLSVKKQCFPQQLERAQALTIAAMKQCGRLTLPQIIMQPPLKEWPPFTGTAFFGDLDSQAPLFEKAWQGLTVRTSPFMFVTGPESGLSKAEIAHLHAQNIQGVKLHDHILRTETASLMAISLLKHGLLVLCNLKGTP